MNYFVKFTILIAMIFSTAIFTGCTQDNLSYIEKASVRFEPLPDEDAFISEIYANEQGDSLLIKGRIKRTANNCCDGERGHIDIAVIAPDGLVIDTTSISYQPRNIPKVRSRSSSFQTLLPYILPEDIIFRIRYHDTPAGNDSIQNSTVVCTQNIALPDLNI